MNPGSTMTPKVINAFKMIGLKHHIISFLQSFVVLQIDVKRAVFTDMTHSDQDCVKHVTVVEYVCQ